MTIYDVINSKAVRFMDAALPPVLIAFAAYHVYLGDYTEAGIWAVSAVVSYILNAKRIAQKTLGITQKLILRKNAS